MENEALKVLDLFKKVQNKENYERELWDKCYAYINNRVDGKLGQWDSSIRSDLEIQGKPAISFNEMKKFINRICGAMIQMKVEEKAFPVDDQSDPLVADVISDLIKHVFHINRADMHYRRMARDGVITGRGFMKVEWSDKYDVTGEITLYSLHPKRVYIIGRGDFYDLSDRKGIVEVLPMDKEEILAAWPEKKRKLDGLIRTLDTDEGIPVADDIDYSFGKSLHLDDVFDPKEQKYNVLRYQRREFKDITFLVRPDGQREEFENAPEVMMMQSRGIEEKEIKNLLAAMQMQIIKKRVPRIKVTTCVADIILEDKWSEYRHQKFDIVPYLVYNDNGLVTGVAQDLIDPQDEINKRHSQAIHLLGTSAKNNYAVQKGFFDDIDDVRKRWGKIGQVFETNGNPREGLMAIENNLGAVPAILNMAALESQEMKEISGLHDASMGQVPQGVKSGRGINELQGPGEIIIGELVENYLESRKLVADLMVSLIQQFYTGQRKVRIVGQYSPGIIDETTQAQMGGGIANVQNGSKVLTINSGAGNDVGVGKYDIVVDHVSHSPTRRREAYFEQLNMKAAGAPIKWSTIIRSNDMPNKEAALRDAMEAEMFMMAAGGGMPPQLAPSQTKTASPPGPIPADEGINTSGAQF